MVDPSKCKSVMISNENHARLRRLGTLGMHYNEVVTMVLDIAESQILQQQLESNQKIEDSKNNKMAGHGLRPLVDQPSSIVADDTAADTTGNTMITLTTATKKAKTTGVFTLNGKQS
jgi:hypothetical protein